MFKYLFFLFAVSLGAESLNQKLIETLETEERFSWRKVEKNNNGWFVFRENFDNIPKFSIPVNPDFKTLTKLFEEKKPLLGALDKASTMDYALPKDYQFKLSNSFSDLGILRGVIDLRTLQLKFSDDDQLIQKAILNFKLMKKTAQQPRNLIDFLVSCSMQRKLITALKDKGLTEIQTEVLKKNLINKKDLREAIKAEVYMFADIASNIKEMVPEVSTKQYSARDMFNTYRAVMSNGQTLEEIKLNIERQIVLAKGFNRDLIEKSIILPKESLEKVILNMCLPMVSVVESKLPEIID